MNPKVIKAFTTLLGLAILSGCGEDLRPKVAELEAQLAKEKAALASTSAELAREKTALASSASDLTRERASAAIIAAKLAVFEKAEADRKAEAEQNASLVVQLGLTMKSGDTKPIANTKVYLMRQSFSDISRGMVVKFDDGDVVKLSPARALGGAVGQYREIYNNFRSQALAKIRAAALVEADSDFNGVATFDNVKKGEYIILCVTPLGGGAALEKKVVISGSKAKVALSNQDTLD